MRNFMLAILFCLSNIGSVYAGIETKWEKIKEKKGLTVFRGEVAGTNVVAFRGIDTIEAPLANVVSVIYDVSRIKEWMSDLHSSRVLSQKTMFEKVEYNRTTAPWPISDRDFIYSVVTKVNRQDKTVEIIIDHAVHPDAPEVEGVVRGELRSGRYFLRSLDDDKRTFIEVEMLADPKGSIPKWVVNLFQQGWPSNTINGIRKLATEPNYVVHPDVLTQFKTGMTNAAAAK